jgi:hypothetical protein
MNHDALHQLLRTRPLVDRLLGSLLAVGAEDGRTTVDDILADGEVPRRQAIVLLRELESLGCGSFKVGRKGHPSRFEWSIDPADLQAVLDGSNGEQAGDESEGEREALLADDDEPANAPVQFMQGKPPPRELVVPPVHSPTRYSREEIDHAYVLRPDYRVTLTLPDNLTRREAEVLADWLRNLSFER